MSEREERFLRGETELVANLRMREAFLRMRQRGEVTPHQLARSLGYVRPGKLMRHQKGGRTYEYRRDDVDTSRVMRALGVYPEVSRGQRRYRQYVNYVDACRIAAALGLDPVAVGL